ncbi:DUF4132 domain-containing protein [Streptomyces sp. TRM66268-LWL]|uniref:DUF4132 domain-containing protein n=1 Tax=Streptomyces polyasparticus TaxID=2767826 RepID=A0ABR7SJQ4_9ACTN|nr:DUF4132 domain-containing protein [Streptomyces polyasparticus]MBC9715726.1 DUF4132 domain-containing protein [Streptomyces polyasparticus]
MSDRIAPLLDLETSWVERMRTHLRGLPPELTDLVLHLADAGTFWDWHYKMDQVWKRRTRELLKADGARDLVATGIRELAHGGSLHDRTEPVLTRQMLRDSGKKTQAQALAFGLALAAGQAGGRGASEEQRAALIEDLVTVARKNGGVLDGFYRTDTELVAAAVTSLGELSAMEELFTLQREVQPGVLCQRYLVKVVKKTAKRLQVPDHELEERTVATGGLDDNGTLHLGWIGQGAVWLNVPFEAVIQVHDDYTVTMEWIDVDRDRASTVTRSPFTSPRGFKERYLPQNVDGARRRATMVHDLVQGERRRLLALSVQDRVWPYGEWARCYRDHPLTGRMTRALAWQYETSDGLWHTGLPDKDTFRLLDGSTVDVPTAARIRLWNAERAEPQEAALIRGRLDELGLPRQPYGQLLTQAP